MKSLASFAAQLAITMSFGWNAFAQNAVTAEPDHLRFATMNDSATIQVLSGGKPLPSKAIKEVRAVIGNNTYTHQFVITKSDKGDATITVKPNPEEAQSGTFTLVISTKQGDALVAVDMPLDQMPDTLENRAKAEGVTVEEMKAKLGLSKEGQRESVTVRLPQWQYEGSTFALRVPTPPGRAFTWKINGTVVDQGLDKNALSYVLGFPGDHRIDMEARQGDAIVAQWSGLLRVIPYPDMKWQVRAREPFVLRAPRGYTIHTWKLDGRDAGKDEEFTHTFKEPGEHTIECIAREPMFGKPGEFRRLLWKTLVNPPRKR
ncbi:MAG: hypothetical protein SGI88_19240 [Candidatus Hydrogenedentes bacterium]|nr:hypothetical protein [Candidatus Hydrogenedentota bacterium]